MGSPVWDWFLATDPQKRIPVQVTDLKAISGDNPRGGEKQGRRGKQAEYEFSTVPALAWCSGAPECAPPQGRHLGTPVPAIISSLLLSQADVSSQTLVLSKLLSKAAPAPQCVQPSLEEAGRGLSERSTQLVGQIQGYVGRAPATVLQVREL